MMFFAGGGPNPNAAPADANPGTFYSAVSNIDIEIQDGNLGCRGRTVRPLSRQHCFLAHMDFHIGSRACGNSTMAATSHRTSIFMQGPIFWHLDSEAVPWMAIYGNRCHV